MSKLLLPILLTFLFTACFREPVYPTLLTEADSAFVRGDYAEADSLLALYDSLTAQTGKQEATATAVGNYRLLLDLEKRFVRDELTEHDFSAADSLCRYYNHRGTTEKHARALIFLGDIYHYGGDNPSALNCYLQAENFAKQTGNTLLQAWACQQIGDIYFDQRMLDDCKAYYRRFYQTAEARRDTLRMAHASQRMGRVYTIEDNVDSALFYYYKGLELSENLPTTFVFSPYLKSNLSDIFIQIGEYDKARELMAKDSINMYNWACLYYGQHKLDSAIYFLQQSLGLYNIQVDVECLEMLADVYSKEGAYRQSNEYFVQLRQADDSLIVISQKEEIRKTQAQFNYSLIKQERDRLSGKNVFLVWVSIIFGIALIAFASPAIKKRIQEYRETKRVRERLRQQEMNGVLKKGTQETEDLKDMVADKVAAFKQTRLYRQLHRQLPGVTDYKLTDNDWQQLAIALDDVYDHFTSRLLAMYDFTSSDLKICYLIKADVPNKDIALLINKTASGVSHAKTRLWKKMGAVSEKCENLEVFIKKL